ncbi:MAG: DNA repair protein [Clostridia bacterium]|nr:DNA repair protein [Clostridia bacterium]
MEDKVYCCIDLKSFFASVECVDRGLDPFKANLVVADPDRSRGAICLAVTPALKNLGVKNRCRIFDIPPTIEYLIARPRMKRYMEKSAEIYSIYLDYISPDDIHVYSIDECFIDLTDYVKIYGKTAYGLSQMLIGEVYKRTGIRATVGIGTNMFLTKIALDITAKHASDFTGYLDENLFKKTIWHHRPITDIWNVGPGIAKRLEKYGIFDLYGVSKASESMLYREFGVNAELLIDHANGIEPCTIADIHNYKSKSNSLSNGQILFSDYTAEDAFTVLKEMVDGLTVELVEKGLVAGGVALSVGFAGSRDGGVNRSAKLTGYTSSYKRFIEKITELYRSMVSPSQKVRRLNVGLTDVIHEEFCTYDLFTDVGVQEKEKNLYKTVATIKDKFGKNAILKGISLEEKATARERNKMIGGHRSGEDE